MENLTIASTERSPAVEFDFDKGRLSFRGESYPEDASAFFGPIFSALDGFLSSRPALAVQFELAYFNSSSAKAFMNILQKLEQAAQSGMTVCVDWRFAEGDDTMKEFGEDFAEDLEQVTFRLVPL